MTRPYPDPKHRAIQISERKRKPYLSNACSIGRHASCFKWNCTCTKCECRNNPK